MANILKSQGIFPFETKWNHPSYLEMLKKAKDWFKDRNRLLDVGCGRGESVNFLKGTGVELRKFETWQKFSNQFIVFNGSDLPFKKGSFDCLFLNNVFEHVKEKDLFVEELKHISEKETTIVLILPTALSKIRKTIRLPKFIIGWIRGYGLGDDAWFVHEKKVYGLNYFEEVWDYFNWKKILSKYFVIEAKEKKLNSNQEMFKCKFK